MEIEVRLAGEGKECEEATDCAEGRRSEERLKRNRRDNDSAALGWRSAQSVASTKRATGEGSIGRTSPTSSSGGDLCITDNGNVHSEREEHGQGGGGNGSHEDAEDDDDGGDDWESTPATGALASQSKWADIPGELLMRIMNHVDHRTLLIASGVCTGWRDSLSAGILEFSFSWCKDEVVGKLIRSIAHKLQNLECLDMRRCPSVNDSSIEAVAQYCSELRVLDLSGAKFTDKALFALANGCPHLTLLDVSGCLNIGEDGVIALAMGCRGLVSLNLCGCERGGTDKSLKAIGAYCRNLQSLNLGWCERITDIGAQALAEGCPDLQNLDLCGCLHITDLSVTALAEKCPRLRALGLHCCRNITDVSINALVNSNVARMRLAHSASLMRRRFIRQCSFGHTGLHSSGGPQSPRWAAGTSSSTRAIEGGGGSDVGNWAHSGLTSSSFPPGGSQCPRHNGYGERAGSQGRDSPTEDVADTDAEAFGLVSLNLSGCISLHASAVQKLCDVFPALHTCEKRSLNVSGCLSLTNVHCRCVSDVRRSRGRGFTRLFARTGNRPL
ncbi:hypothetical protein CBR_g791 [Chara braunii]|uniref:Uncharacterized protein n=1 Tax=Chara braunii TaxID=69332 RepID=A0A388KCJ1_CHABU|nr:hypothetical protein CBR_g791 [Chara braunii]|eukprot:GBG67663.1 hypothetical protein CBR_g791 [Chara braunii]